MSTEDNPVSLPSPARYFPPAGGRYRIEPGLSKLSRDFGNAHADGQAFQIDASFPAYRAAKLAARRERLGKYFQTHQFTPQVSAAVCAFIIDRLTAEHPLLFHRGPQGGTITLSCRLTGDELVFDEEMRLIGGATDVTPPCRDALDALACQVQEDLAVISTGPDHGTVSPPHWLSAVHLCFPNHWAAEDKIGKPFVEIHRPVAGIEPVNRQADHLVRVMVNATDGLVRFAWGITTDPHLNHHPEGSADAPTGVTFNPAQPSAFVRVERQTMWGFPAVGAALFTIRTYLLDCRELSPVERADLAAAVESMTPESVAYKGLAWKHDFLAWLRALPA